MLSDAARHRWKLMQPMPSLENSLLRVTVQWGIPQRLLRAIEYRRPRDLAYSISQLSISIPAALSSLQPTPIPWEAFHLIHIAFFSDQSIEVDLSSR